MPRKGKLTRKVCRNCKAILDTNATKCSYCGSNDLSEDYAGFLIIIDEEKSEISNKKGIKKGIWAIKVF